MITPVYQNQVKRLHELAERYDLKLYCIGRSVCRRKIRAMDIGQSAQRCLLVGGVHGTEYLTVSAALQFAEDYAKHPCGMQLTVIPCLNPDGTETALKKGIYWQANARGVDLNHNFDAGWQKVKQREISLGITSPAPTRYGGTYPESEPETRAVVRLCEAVRYERVLALHSQGREIYWDFGAHTPPCCLPLAEKMARAGGYRVASPEAIATGGGFKDWFIERFHRCGFTVEIGQGKNPLPLRALEKEYPHISQILRVFVSG
ncbi:MAG: gamma-D-glutamyl-meso-diaminopimelate peptidase [Ruminococcus sp.]|nr:gamma-D-glutamyl-meso-diaminopimelate peptidase [Ruminococcus sp.]